MRVQRIRGSDLKTETIVDLAGMRLVQDSSLGVANSGHWIGLAADGSIVLTRDIGSSEIYALDVKWP